MTGKDNGCLESRNHLPFLFACYYAVWKNLYSLIAFGKMLKCVENIKQCKSREHSKTQKKVPDNCFFAAVKKTVTMKFALAGVHVLSQHIS